MQLCKAGRSYSAEKTENTEKAGEGMETEQSVVPRAIRIFPEDNVAVAANENGLKRGMLVENILLQEDVPQGHKFTLCQIPQGAAVIRYGQVIGRALSLIEPGCWINEHMLELPDAPELEHWKIEARTHAKSEPLAKEYCFQGYKNPDGSTGIRNILGILPTVQCAAGVLNQAVAHLKQTLLPRYPHVDDIVALNHSYGCGVAIQAPEAKVPIRTLQNLATHPNLGGELILVSLGCEKLQPETLVPAGTHPEIIVLQEEQGFGKMMAAIEQAAVRCLERLEKRRRVTCPAADLVIGLQCGGSDAFSGITANPAIGYAADLLVRAGASVMFSEVTEVRDGIHLLLPRAASIETEQKLVDEMKWYDRYLALGGADRSANPAPGNKKGGLANIAEKALGSIAKSGSMPIAGVLSPGEKALQKGLLYAATPASDFICGTQQLASGMHLQVFSTGRGTTYGLALAPVIKVSTHDELKMQWEDLIDVNAGRIISGEASIAEVGQEIFAYILASASGEKETWAEHWKLYNDLCLFNPAPVT